MSNLVPQQLSNLIAGSITPGSKITRSIFNDGSLEFQFEIQWRDFAKTIKIPRRDWDDRAVELIKVISRLTIPFPEITRKGKRFWVRYDDEEVEVLGDYTNWIFYIQTDLGQPAIRVPAKITGTAHSLIEHKSNELSHHQRAFRIETALWQIKTYYDEHNNFSQNSKVEINSTSLPNLFHPPHTNDETIRKYVSTKLHQAYKGSQGSVELEFNWADFIYLGIQELDFRRAIKLREDHDWTINGLVLSPTNLLLEQLDKTESLPLKNLRSELPYKRLQPNGKNQEKKYGKWEIIRSLSEGGQAHTFLVKDLTDPKEKPYVLKRLKNPQRIGRFKREIEIGLKLNHPNIVKVIDFDLEGQRPYFVCEYYDGGDLKKKGAGARLDHLENLKFFHSICKGVASAHENKITHRDLNPKNIFIKTGPNQPVVGDFGICFIDDEGQRFTTLEEAVGPRLYIAPELEDGRLDKISHHSDVYSLGKILYWLITGDEFSREKHRAVEYDLVKRFHDPKLEHINRLLDKMIVADPEKRLLSANEVLKGLEEVIVMLENRFNGFCQINLLQTQWNGFPHLT